MRRGKEDAERRIRGGEAGEELQRQRAVAVAVAEADADADWQWH